MTEVVAKTSNIPVADGGVMVPSSLVTGTMPAAVYQGHGTVTVERLPIPEPGNGEVLLAVSHCGICGSDLHLMMEDWGQPGSTGGHEYSGVIVAVGEEVSGWDVGDRVVGEHPGITLTSFYVGYMLPMMLEVQHFAFGDQTAS
jgi:Alcohol dehydrogenase GroES-like domain